MHSKTPVHSAKIGLVLSGGGARGYAHVGVLQALEHYGVRPSVIVGVSMGAIVGAVYGLNPNWYQALRDMDVSGFPRLPDFSEHGVSAMIGKLLAAQRAITEMYFGWGIGQSAVDWGMEQLTRLTLAKNLEDARIPVLVAATDLQSGKRVILGEGSAVDAVYASCALAGVLPPKDLGGRPLVDGGYADIAPVDVAHDAGAEVVIAVDPADTGPVPLPKNGVGAMLRSIEICQNEHARLRLRKADLVLRPHFPLPIGTLDFHHRRAALAAGIQVVRRNKSQILALA